MFIFLRNKKNSMKKSMSKKYESLSVVEGKYVINVIKIIKGSFKSVHIVNVVLMSLIKKFLRGNIIMN